MGSPGSVQVDPDGDLCGRFNAKEAWRYQLFRGVSCSPSPPAGPCSGWSRSPPPPRPSPGKVRLPRPARIPARPHHGAVRLRQPPREKGQPRPDPPPCHQSGAAHGSDLLRAGWAGGGRYDVPAALHRQLPGRAPGPLRHHQLGSPGRRGQHRGAVLCPPGGRRLLLCRGTDPTVNGFPAGRTQMETWIARYHRFGARCLQRNGNLPKHISTVDTVRDLDLMRRRIGGGKINCPGTSYGTIVGAVYANMLAPTEYERRHSMTTAA